MKIKFNRSFGAHGKGRVIDVPSDAARALIRAGVADLETEAAPLVEEPDAAPTVAYKPGKAIKRAVRKG